MGASRREKNNNENNRQCLEREIIEELNININIKNKIGSIKHNYSHFNIDINKIQYNLV